MNISCLPPLTENRNNLHIQCQKANSKVKSSNYVRNVKIGLLGSGQEELLKEFNKKSNFSKFKESVFDNIRTDHFFHDGSMVSLEIWNCDDSKGNGVFDILKSCNIFIVCFPDNHPNRREEMQRCSKLIYLNEPTCLILLAELRRNEFLLTDRALDRVYAGEMNALGASDFISVNLCNFDHVQEAFVRATTLAFQKTNSSLVKKHLSFAEKYIKQRYAEWEQRLPPQYKSIDKLSQLMSKEQMEDLLNDMDKLVQAMEKLYKTSHTSIKKYWKKGKKMQEAIEKILVL
jgi:uncharacterized coiled-coil protein SlyX